RCVHLWVVRDQDQLIGHRFQRAPDAVDDPHPADFGQRLRRPVAYVAPSGQDRAERPDRPGVRHDCGLRVVSGTYTCACRLPPRAPIGMPAASATCTASVVGIDRLTIQATPQRAPFHAISPLILELITSPRRARSASASIASPIALSTAACRLTSVTAWTSDVPSLSAAACIPPVSRNRSVVPNSACSSPGTSSGAGRARERAGPCSTDGSHFTPYSGPQPCSPRCRRTASAAAARYGSHSARTVNRPSLVASDESEARSAALR